MTTRAAAAGAVVAVAAMLAIAAGTDPSGEQVGANPDLPAPQRGLLPQMGVARPAPWGDRRPTVPRGWTITAIASELRIPRQTLALPNGDILVAEGKGKSAPMLTPKDYIAGILKSRGATSVEGGDRLTLLRDADGDGSYEGRWVYAENLNAPYGLALVGNRLYVANQDALVRFDYEPGQTRAAAAPVTVTPLPSAVNHHWTKALAADASGRFLYVGIGSNSNIGERGMALEEDRAMVWQVDADSGASRPYATGLRNPTALAFEPGSGRLWAVVNERDELGPDLVPDYLTSVREGAFYGWPYAYWGQNLDPRVRPPRRAEGEGQRATGLRTAVAFGAARARVRKNRGRGPVRRGRLRRPARQLEPQAAGGLQGRLRAVPQWPPERRAGGFRHRIPGRWQHDGPPGRRDGGRARRGHRRR